MNSWYKTAQDEEEIFYDFHEGDIAKFYVEGGTRSLNELSGLPSEEQEGNMAKQAQTEHDLDCPECGAKLKLTEHPEYGLYYRCERWPDCRVTHGALKDGRPRGVPGDIETINLRKAAHRKFDELWKNNPDHNARSKAYAWLANKLGVPKSKCHMAMFDKHTLKQVISICNYAIEQSKKTKRETEEKGQMELFSKANIDKKFTYIGQCDKLRGISDEDEQKWKKMIDCHEKVSLSEFLENCDMSKFRDGDDELEESLSDDPSSYVARSVWGDSPCYYIYSSGFEFVFVSDSSGANWYKTASSARELIDNGVQIIDDYAILYRGTNIPNLTMKDLRYGDFLSSVPSGTDITGNSGADAYGKHVVKYKISIKDIKITNGELQYIGNSKSLEGNKYPIKIYKAFNDYYGSNYTAQQINDMDYKDVRNVASQALSDGKEEFDLLMEKHNK